jgi:hypothetical protein
MVEGLMPDFVAQGSRNLLQEASTYRGRVWKDTPEIGQVSGGDLCAERWKGGVSNPMCRQVFIINANPGRLFRHG